MQKKKSKPNGLTCVFYALIVLFLANLACSMDTGNGDDEDVKLEQTMAAIQLTQIALENQSGSSGEVQDGEDPTPLAPEPSPTFTEAAIEPEPPDVSYKGTSFSFDPAIGAGVIPETVEGQNLGEDFMSGETFPTHFKFTWDNYAINDHFHTPNILIYPVAEYRAISQPAADVIANLQAALANRPGGSANSTLPFLPMWPAAQVFSAKVQYFDFQNGSGVRYLTMYAQALYPVDNQNLFYTYQGLTHDGAYYLSAVLPITHPALPYDGGAGIEDWMAFEQNWETYLAETMRLLGEQPPHTFFPSMVSLDEMMASFQINR